MFRWITITLLTVTIVGLAVFGYKEHQDKNAILIQAENSYQRAFHELTSDVDTLHDKIGATLAMNSRKQLSPQMAEIWRLTSEASSDVGQLPLTLMPFNKTEEFLYDIGDFAYDTAIRDLDKEPLSDQEIAGLEELYKQSGDVKNELRKVQNMVLRDNLRWMDVELALATNEETGDNTIINGFETVEKSMDGFQQTNAETGISARPDENDLSHLKGDEITKKEAIKSAQNWFGKVEPDEFTVTNSGKGADIPTVTASFHNEERNGYMDMTKQGGYPLTIMVSRDVEDSKISLNEASEKAKTYVDKLELKDMEMVESNQYDNEGVFKFVYKKDGVRYYPGAVQVKVALDNGEMLGLDALQYYSRPNETIEEEPGLSEDEAKEMINPNLDVQENHLAVIEDEEQETILCYEFLTTKDDETYRIFINADNGHEEKVETLKTKEARYDVDVS
ncbi:germination protein YpeB [Halobacillus sp. Marseille-P3879]|uniref:germination protein YpeB n=1 Tax=Halobacillus TaxID=45667 RepID=UPI000C7D82C2|nr:germination protein YpeB [Halobacillus sp. Marseille-P3879]